MDVEFLYTKDYYKDIREGSRRSAKEIVPLVLELIHPGSVIDVGCGVGTWLSVFKECGVRNIMGVDGDHIDKKMLQIPQERFLSFDLRKPLRMDRQFDLVVSLEVAEHLPSECAERFVHSLVRLGPVILFSAAIPFQGGVHHMNEQWPDYWVKHFQRKGYVVIDCIREKFWQNDNVEMWYAQNILMFVRQDYLKNYPLFKKMVENAATSQLSIVHPRKYLALQEKWTALQTQLQSNQTQLQSIQIQLQSNQTQLQSILNSKSYKLLSYLGSNLKKLPFIRDMLKHMLDFFFGLHMKFCKKVEKRSPGK